MSLEDWHRLVALGDLYLKRPRLGLPIKPIGLPSAEHLYYAITPQAQKTMDAHAQSNRDVEVGGVLLGEVYQEKEVYYVSVTDALPARHTTFGLAYLTFTGRTWLDIINRRRAHHAEKKTVGWYHTHPGLGVFLSGSDRFAHRSFFGDQPWYIALVVDPVSGEQGVFVWDGGQIVRCLHACTLTDLPAEGDRL